MSHNIQDGFNLDELLAIGTRKRGLDLNISATDINNPISFAEGQIARERLSGFSEDQLKDIAARKVQLPTMQPDEINRPRVAQNLPESVSQTLDSLQKFLGIRTK